MASQTISGLTNYVTPLPSDVIAIVDVTNGITKKVTVQNLLNSFALYNQSTSNQGAGFSADTYVTGSSITLGVPTNILQTGTRYHCLIRLTKTNAGTATPILTVRYGTGGSTSDAAICQLTFAAGTAASDTGVFEVWVTFNSVGSGTSAVMNGVSEKRHGASITGFGTLVSESQQATSSGFDSTPANSIIGVSLNGGASASWTVQMVQAELTNLA